MTLFSKDFFRLQLNFADRLAKKHKMDFKDVVFAYTSVYVRLLGYSDFEKPSVNNQEWKRIIEMMPDKVIDQADYVYDLYSKYEREKKPVSRQGFGCFFCTYHTDTKMYELHFDPVDPGGNLGKDRIEARMAELKSLFGDIKLKAVVAKGLLCKTWLFNIGAFNRLFPKKFSDEAVYWKEKYTQTNSHWGQFVDRFGKVKKDLAIQLMTNVEREKHDQANLYFPLPAKYAECSLEKFYEFYGVK